MSLCVKPFASMNSLFSNSRRTLFLVFFVALLTRGAFILTQQNGFYFPDSLQYSQAAVNLLTVGELGANYDRAPAYPVFLAVVYFLFGESIFAIRIVESFMGALLALILAALGRRIAGETVGALAGLIWAVYPMGIFIAGLVYPTNLTAMLLACGVWCALPATHEELSPKGVFSAGLFFGLAALAIPVALLTILVVATWVFFRARYSRVLLTSFFLLGTAVSLGPWTARNFLIYGQLVPIQANFEQQFPRMATRETKSTENPVNEMFRRPDLYANHFGRNFLRFWELYPSGIKMGDQDYRDKLYAKDSRVVKETIYTPNRLINAVSILSTGPIFVFALLGTAAMCLRRDLRRALSIFWITTLSFAVGYAFFFAKIRYRIPVEPFLIILSAYGINAAYAMLSACFIWSRNRTGRSSLVDQPKARPERPYAG